MVKLENYFKIIFSSKYLIFSLVITSFIFSMINFIFVKYLDVIMIIDPDYLFFWKPFGYLTYPERVYGPSLLFGFLYFLFLLYFLYLSNYEKKIKNGFVLKSFLFFVFYFWIWVPERAYSPGATRSLIEKVSWSPLESYMKNTRRDFDKELTTTPFGIYKMFGDKYSDKLRVLQNKCTTYVDSNKKCYDYPFSI